jgi:RNA recognition motif-containing protein
MERNRQADLSILARKPFGDADLSALGRVAGAERGSRSPFSTTDADSSINLQRLSRVNNGFGALGRVDTKDVVRPPKPGPGSRSNARGINLLASAAAQVERAGLHMPDVQATRNRNPKKSKIWRHPLEDSSVSQESSMTVQPLSLDSPTRADLFGNPISTSGERDLFPSRSRSRESFRPPEVYPRAPDRPWYQDVVQDDSAPKLDFNFGTDTSQADSSGFGAWGKTWDFGSNVFDPLFTGTGAKDGHRNSFPTEISATRLYLGNLPGNTTKRDIENHFSAHCAGTITEIKLMNGFGFIEYDDPMDARDVVPAFNGSEFKGERLVVQFARQDRKQNSNIYSNTPGGAPVQSPFLSHVDYDRFRQLNSPPGQHLSPLGNSQHLTQQRPSMQGSSMEFEPLSETQKKKNPFEHADCSFYLHYTIAEDRSGTADEVMSKRLAPLVDRHQRSKKDSNTKKIPAWQDDEADVPSSSPSYPVSGSNADKLIGQLQGLAKGADRLHTWNDRRGTPRHADLKPENILVFPESTKNTNGKVPKIDSYPPFGAARFQQVESSPILSSTHSPYSFTSDLDETQHEEKTRCPYPECGGRAYKDIKAHMLALHQPLRPEKCPVTSCEYATKGFARKYDQRRHTLTHFKGTLVCDFCPGYGSANEKSFNRADVFKRHLNKIHDVEQVPPRGRGKSKPHLLAAKAGKCSVCLGVFDNPQYFYDHLDGCILDVVHETANFNRDDLLAIAGLNQRGFEYIKCMDAYFDANRHTNVAIELLVDRQARAWDIPDAQKRVGRDDGFIAPYVDEQPTRFLRVEIGLNDEKDFVVLETAIKKERGFVHFTWQSYELGRTVFIEFKTSDDAAHHARRFLDWERALRDTSCTIRTMQYVKAGDMPWLNPNLANAITSPEEKQIRSPLERLARKSPTTSTALPASLPEADDRTPLRRLATNQIDTSEPFATSEALQRLARNKDYSLPVRRKDDATSSVNPATITKMDPSNKGLSGKGNMEYDPWRDHFD